MNTANAASTESAVTRADQSYCDAGISVTMDARQMIHFYVDGALAGVFAGPYSRAEVAEREYADLIGPPGAAYANALRRKDTVGARVAGREIGRL